MTTLMQKTSVVLIGLILLSLSACQEYSPKPNAYHRIIYPAKAYTLVQTDCPFEFEIPVYSKLESVAGNNDCWYNLNYQTFNATLHLSYRHVNGQASLDSLMEDAYNLAFKHISKAEEISEREFHDTLGNYGIIYDLQGKTATPINFYITDKKEHFFRGSFYFNVKTNRDSVAEVYQFLKKDIIHGMETFRWK